MTSSHDDEKTLGAVRAAADGLRLSDDARARIERKLAGGAAGATTLRAPEHRWPRRTIWSAAVAAAAILVTIALLPAIDRQTTISAAEILGRSQQALSAHAAGIEVLTYDLTVEGVLEQLLPRDQTGRFTVEEVIDHDHPGRYRLLKLAPDGQVVGGIADDPLAGARSRYVKLDGQGVLLQLTDTSPGALSVVALKRLALQTLIAMMQASEQKVLRELDRDGEPAYEIAVRGTPAPAGVITLKTARAVVGKVDARLLEFDAEGTIGSQPFAVTFNLRTRDLRPAEGVRPSDFAIEPQAGDRVIQARGDQAAPLWTVVEQCLGR